METTKRRPVKARNYQVRNQVAEIIENTSKNRISYGLNDKLPNELIRNVQDSGTAMLCIGKRKSFIQGDGFQDPNVARMKVNKDQTADDILDDITLYDSYFTGFYLNVLYDMQGNRAAAYHVPVEKIRKNDDGSFRYNYRMGERGYKEAEDIIYQPFNPNLPPNERLARINYEISTYGRQLGDMLQVLEKGAGFLHNQYAIPPYYSGIDDIISDASLSKLEKRNLKKGWRANVIISMPGELDDDAKDDRGKTDQDHFDDTVKSFTGEDAASVMVLWGKTKESKPDVNVISLYYILDATDKATDRLTRKVCRLMEVPPVLIGMTTPGQLGNTDEIINLIKLFNLMVLKAQNRITRAMSMVFPGIDWSIQPLNVLDELPDFVVEQMTAEEKREAAGLPPLENTTPTAQEQTINTLNSVSPLVANKILGAMTINELRKLAGLEPVEGGDIIPNATEEPPTPATDA